jgi:hypothetical protein
MVAPYIDARSATRTPRGSRPGFRRRERERPDEGFDALVDRALPNAGCWSAHAVSHE